MNHIIENTKVSSESVSMTVQSGTTGDMFQAYLLNVAFSCMDAFSVTLLKSNKRKKRQEIASRWDRLEMSMIINRKIHRRNVIIL